MSLTQKLFRSLQSRIMINIILVHALMMSALVYELMSREEALLTSMTHTQAQDIASGIASSAYSALLTNDFAGLNELITVFKRQKSIDYLIIVRADGRILAHTQAQYIGRYLDDPSSMLLHNHPPEILTLIDTPNQLDVAAPISATTSEQPIGWVRLSLNLNQQRENQAFIMQRGIIYTALAIFFGGFIAWLLAQKTARSLQNIQQASQAFADGNTHARVPKQPFSELQLLAKGMNVLLDTIHLREQELINANNQMTFLAMHDSLTQLANQRAFYDKLHQVTKNKLTTGISLVMIDLDGFKPINDNLGHDTGDAVLVIVAQRLRVFMSQKQDGLAARLGGDEFTLVIMHSDRLAEDLDNLRAQLAESYIVDNRTIGGVSASIGAVVCPQGESIDEMRLLKLADKAMYEAKNNGRNRVVIANCSQA